MRGPQDGDDDETKDGGWGVGSMVQTGPWTRTIVLIERDLDDACTKALQHL